MRIWSLHPKYLDSKGLVALWRETLLAKKVLQNLTKGYKNHPQLIRFKQSKNPLKYINKYLSSVYDEAKFREFNFDKSKIDYNFNDEELTVTLGQIDYEKKHLLNKLQVRDQKKYLILQQEKEKSLHPLFTMIEGEVEDWEIVY